MNQEIARLQRLVTHRTSVINHARSKQQRVSRSVDRNRNDFNDDDDADDGAYSPEERLSLPRSSRRRSIVSSSFNRLSQRGDKKVISTNNRLSSLLGATRQQTVERANAQHRRQLQQGQPNGENMSLEAFLVLNTEDAVQNPQIQSDKYASYNNGEGKLSVNKNYERMDNLSSTSVRQVSQKVPISNSSSESPDRTAHYPASGITGI